LGVERNPIDESGSDEFKRIQRNRTQKIKEKHPMKIRLLMVVLFSGTLPVTAMAQQVRMRANDTEVAAPPLDKVLGAAKPDIEVLTSLLPQKWKFPWGLTMFSQDTKTI
jgi:hypothetical protein